jgi:hypothetical protein
MDCPHCGIAFHENWKTGVVREPTNEDKTVWMTAVTRCPACRGEIIRLLHLGEGGRDRFSGAQLSQERVDLLRRISLRVTPGPAGLPAGSRRSERPSMPSGILAIFQPIL